MKKLFLLALTATALSACKKDSDTTPSRTELLTGREWHITAETETVMRTPVGGSPTPVVFDRYAGMPACERDNIHKFNVNKSRVIDEGLSKCLSTDPQSSTSTWDFTSDQTKMLLPNLASPATSIEVDIVELTASTLRLRVDLSGKNTDVVETTFTAF
jgi:hypothetical protein